MRNAINLLKSICLSFVVIGAVNVYSFKPHNDSTRIQGESCTLPEHPNFGEWFFPTNAPSNSSPGALVNSNVILLVRCKPRHKLHGNSILFCNSGTWSSDIGQCLETCPDLQSTATTKVTCIFKNRETENCTDAVSGTLARFRCASFYEDCSLTQNPFQLCRNGSWNQPKPQCVPVCGQQRVAAPVLLISGTPVSRGDFPWQVVIYKTKDKQLVCTGTLLNQRVILTAAHCVTTDKGKVLNKEDYTVAVGKSYREYDDLRDRNVGQFSPLEAIFIPEQYKGELQNYLGDIAVLVTKESFILSREVQPACVDWGLNYNNEFSNPSSYGYVTGWGYISQNSSRPSDVPKVLKVPFISNEKCRESLPEDLKIQLTFDKLCAEYSENGTSVCKADTGGGLVFKQDGRYYVAGIVNFAPQFGTEVGGCDNQQYAFYTKVSDYNIFIQEKESQYKI